MLCLYMGLGAGHGFAQKEMGTDSAPALENESQSMLPTMAVVGEPPAAGPASPATVVRRIGPSTIDEIVVTAQKREEAITDVPISISAFSGDDLKSRGVNDTRGLSNLVPGFSGYGVPIYSLRGIGFNDPSQTASSAVGVYTDEFNLPFPVFTKGGNLDIKRVQAGRAGASRRI